MDQLTFQVIALTAILAQSKTDLPPPTPTERLVIGLGLIVVGVFAAGFTAMYPGGIGPFVAPNVRPKFAVVFGLGFVAAGLVLLLS
jgi:hypothetical protein